jgi:hypothetical protein
MPEECDVTARALEAAVAEYEPILTYDAPASYLCGGASYLVPAGDWSIAYHVGPALKARLARRLRAAKARR